MRTHRTIEIAWLPRTEIEWAIFTKARAAAADLWNKMVGMHAIVRRFQWKWPSEKKWMQWCKGKVVGISAQSIQEIVTEFLEAVKSARALRKNGEDASYPWKTKKYKDFTYTNQGAKVTIDGLLRLSHGKDSDPLFVRIPKTLKLPGRIMEVRLSFGSVRIICEHEHPDVTSKETIGVDLGVNSIIAATNGKKAIVISGRELKATIQWRNKCLSELSSLQGRCIKGSRRWSKLQKSKRKMLLKTERKVKDILHKATRIVAREFPNAHVVVGKPFNEASMKTGRVQAQQVSSVSTRKVISMLNYKLAGAEEVPEPYSSQTCPKCGNRKKCKRVYQCDCGYVAPRDVVGSTNIRRMKVSDPSLPTEVRFFRPLKKSIPHHAGRCDDHAHVAAGMQRN